MPVIYINNFRGFENTFLQLKSINFFVGENSTGKTSLLKLINALSYQDFWFNDKLDFANFGFGYFSEITFKGKKKYFEIGIFNDQYIDDSFFIDAVKLRFIDNKDVPTLKEMFFINGNLDIHVLLDNGKIKYRYRILDQPVNGIDFFKNWISKNPLKNKKFIKVNGKNYLGSKDGFLFAQISTLSHIKEQLKTLEYRIQIPYFLKQFAWIAPIRVEPKRTYDSYTSTFNPDGTHSPYLLKKIIGGNSEVQQKDKIKTILNRFGQDSGLFDEVIIKSLGNTETSPFELYISLNKKLLKITNVGYGVSQILPLVIEIISRPDESWFAIQQPEIHLHPKGQAAFGDLIYKSFELDKKHFIVETHSDYIIDRFRLRISENYKQSKPEIDSQIVFFQRNSKGNSLCQIPINSDGSLSDNQPSEFSEFFIKEELALIQI